MKSVILLFATTQVSIEKKLNQKIARGLKNEAHSSGETVCASDKNYYYPLGAFILFRERKGTNNNQLTHGMICPYNKFNQLGLGVVYLATNVFKTKKSKTKIGDPCVSVMDQTLIHYQNFEVGKMVQIRKALLDEWQNAVVVSPAQTRKINETDIAKNGLPGIAKHRGTLEFLV